MDSSSTPDSPPQIVPATGADLDACRRIDPHVPVERLAHAIACGDVLVANTGGEFAGVLRVEWLWSKHPFLASLFIAEPHRGQGLGSALLAALETSLQRRGFRRLLSSTMPDNLPSQRWHRSRGFVEIGFLAGINAGGVGEIFYARDL